MHEKLIENVIEDICNIIIERKVFYNGNLIGIILTGSYAQAKHHPHSDLDIHVIVDVDDEKQDCTYTVDGRILQLHIYSFTVFKQKCLAHERGRPASYACKVLYDTTDLCKQYIDASAKYEKEGPLPLSKQEKEQLLAKIVTEIYTAEGLLKNGNKLSALIIANEVVVMAINYYNDSKAYWMSNNNYLFEELRKHDYWLGVLAKTILFCPWLYIKLRLLKVFCSKCIVGFNSFKFNSL